MRTAELSSDLDLLREQNRLFDAAIEGMSHGLCMVDPNERMIVCNAHYLRMFSLDPLVIRPGVAFIDILRHSVEVGAASQNLEELYAIRKDVIAAGKVATYHEQLSDGRVIAISHRPMPIVEGAPKGRHGHGGWVSIYEDVTRQRQAEQALLEQNRRFDAALSNMGQGLCMFDADARLMVHNERYLELFGLPSGTVRAGERHPEIVGRLVALGRYAEGIRAEAVCEATRGQIAAMAVTGRPSAPLLWTLSNGRVLEASSRIMTGGGWVTTFEDITERCRSEAQIAHMARHDALTNLPNRATFEEGIEQALASVRRGATVAIFYLDLDGFKTVNDTYGHHAGDALLKRVADRLRGCLRETDTVARLGGDEFAILQIGLTDPGDAVVLADRVLKTFAEPFELEGQRIRMALSIGIALAPLNGAQSEKLMKSADFALYRAKADGGRTYRLFEPAMEARLQARRELEGDLREAIEAQRFELVYQPLIDTRSNAVAGFEALLRWDCTRRGRVCPSEFIPIAEETGLIGPIGDWAMLRACADAAAWPEPLPVAVNISPVQLKDPSLVEKIAKALASTGMAPSRLEVEITETVLLGDDEVTLRALHDLHAMGVRVSMDDFGTGFSSLSYLRSFPFDKLKVDRSFIQELGVKAEAAAIVRAITMLAKSLGMEITAEGVETVEQHEILKVLGCTQLQGYLFSPPKSAADVPGIIASFGARSSTRP